MRHLLTIMAHRGAQPAIDLHMPLWRAHGADIIIFCPEDSPVKMEPGVCVLAMGKAEHHGPESIRRFRFLLNHLEQQQGYDSFSIFEYDSFCLAGHIQNYMPIKPGIAGHRFGDNQPNRGFKGEQYFHPPLLLWKMSLEYINRAAMKVDDYAEQSYWDRWLGYVVELAGIPVHDFLKAGEGFSRNTIEPPEIVKAVEAQKAGAVFFHGVKTKECLEAILAARKQP